MKQAIPRQKFINRASCNDLGMAQKLQDAALHHIDGFNYMLSDGIKRVTEYMTPIDIVQDKARQSYLPFSRMSIWIQSLEVGKPTKQSELGLQEMRLFPQQCRIGQKTYGAPLLATIGRQIDDSLEQRLQLSLGDIPIVVRCDNCHLHNLTPKQLVAVHEDNNEFGGYFIVNGNEKFCRMLIMQKRNYPIAFVRSGYVHRGPNYTSFAVQMKCVREDLFAKTITLHYLTDGNVFLRILHRKQEFLVPVIVILRALIDTTDSMIYSMLVKGDSGNSMISDRVEVMLKGAHTMNLLTRESCLAFLGRNFRVVLGITNPDLNDRQVGEIFINENICVHLKSNTDKFNIIGVMIDKLYALVSDQIAPDNLDALQNQEVLLPGHLYQMILQQSLDELLMSVRLRILKDGGKVKDAVKTRSLDYLKRIIDTQQKVGDKLSYFLSTGNLRSTTGLDLMQAQGFTVIADKLNNMRYLSHFRSVHRGAYFAEMKTTTVRKLLPQSWGFLCPVHTPDGGPCGLLNHITRECRPITHPYDEEKRRNLQKIIASYGMTPLINDLLVIMPAKGNLPVLLDGKLLGHIEQEKAQKFSDSLRYLKTKEYADDENERIVPQTLEIATFLHNGLQKTPVFPGIFIATNEARLVRPVKHLAFNQIEWISPLEQINLSIAVTDEDIRNDSEYQELSPHFFLSILPSNIPFLNYNQSPRNMYQCQMAKQTLGTAVTNYPYRFDNRIYRLMTPQIPAVKGFNAEDYGLTDYPSGTNAIVAVISYTGYDMEDAMILNKSSYQRGFAHGCVYKNYSYNVNEESSMGRQTSQFKLLQLEKNVHQNITQFVPVGVDMDGIPPIGTLLKKNDPVFSVYDSTQNSTKTVVHQQSEQGRLDSVAMVTTESGDMKFEYKIRYSRNPIIGDKFSSRHGQKGVLSILWPHVDMPFTESGMTPDVIINPHAFPSRMTIGMLIQSMAGKSGSLNGNIVQTQPFSVYEGDDVVKYFGDQLVKNGYNYYGNEVMYSGTFGTVMNVDIFMGVVYYQRLRHMVSDKSQARSTGPVDILTQQPIQGRKKGGGIRMGEMQRDALLAHGISFCLYDRFLMCSDYSEAYICDKCGSLLSSYLNVTTLSGDLIEGALLNSKAAQKSKPYCKKCDINLCSKVGIPFVLRYLANQLAAMNIKMEFQLK